MDFELKAAKAKWEKEQAEKKEKARARLERERKAREAAARQRDAIEEARRRARIEAAEAASQAERQAEEDLERGDGVRYNRLLRAFKIPGDGDKITLPASHFEDLASQNTLDKGPMFFEISRNVSQDSSSQIATYGGVREFTADTDSVGLPDHVWSNVNLPESSDEYVRVRYVRLQKGNYAKLQPESADFSDVPNHKAVLESRLRHHAALSQGDVLKVNFGGVDHRLRVLELKPASTVSVLETDIEVDLELPRDESSQRKLVQLTMGKAETGTVREGEYKYYKFSVDQNLAEATGRGETEVVIQLQVGDSQGDADIYVAAHPVVFPSRDEHQWSSHDTGTKVINMAGLSLHPGIYSVAVYGFRGVSSFILSVEAKTSKGKSVAGQKVGSVELETQQNIRDSLQTCGHCKQMIPSRTLPLHEAYCRRHNVACNFPGCGIVFRREDAAQHVHCPKCGDAFRQDELQKHTDVFHVVLGCECGALLEMQEMVKHKASSCPLRKITCRFCGDIVQAGGDARDVRDRLSGLSEHESSCGSRTDVCDLCHRSVMLKAMELHRAAVHSGQTTAPSPAPAPAMPVPVVSAPAPTRHVNFDDSSSDPDYACPLCATKLDDVSGLNLHIASEHFPNGPAAAPPLLASGFRQTLSVLCPICGMAVHSERDLSYHIDMVH